MNQSDRPSLDLATQDPLAPMGPWCFLSKAGGGGFTRLGLEFMASWVAFFLLSNVFWAIHLKGLAGWSSLPSYWGEILTVRDLWELVENGGLKVHATGPIVPLVSVGCFLWFLWAGWRVQAAAAGLRPRLGAWCWGLLDAVLIGAVPLFLVAFLLTGFFSKLGSSGIQGLSWLEWVGGTLVRMSCLSAFFLQWWLCRLGRAGGSPCWKLGSWKALGAHLGHSFLRLWLHPVQWGLLVAGGVVVRTGLSFLMLLLAWRLGGGTPLRVWGLLLLQGAVVFGNAWLIGWFLRLVALYGRHDAAVRAEIQQLRAQAWGGEEVSSL